MKILYITLENLSLHKGSVVHIKEVIDGLRQRGHQVGLIGSAWPPIENVEPFYNIHPKTSFPFKFLIRKEKSYWVSSLLLFLFLLKVIQKYDMIYARDFHTVLIALFPRLLFKKKLVFEINGIASEEQRLKGHSFLNHILVFLIQKAEKMATKYSDRIISVTPHIGTYLIENYKCAPDKVIAIGNGVNTKKFYSIHDEALLEQWKKKFGITKWEIVIMFVGNLAPWQGVETLIQVAPLLLRETRNIQFLIIGDGLLKEAFEAKVKSLGVSDHFIFTGMVIHKEIPLYINIADICVLPKRRLKSGYSPIKLYEYMACGKPVVASRVEGLEFIEEEGTGLLVEPENVKNLEKELNKLIQEPQERVKMGQRSLHIARERFSWESRVIQIEEVLRKMA